MMEKCKRCGKERKLIMQGKNKGFCNSCVIKERSKYHKKKSYASKKNQFNKINKNYVRNKVIEIMNYKGIKNILTLESSEFLFCNKNPEKNIFVFEYADKEFKKMQKTKPDNVKLFYGDVSQAKDIENIFDCIYLDFCYSFDEASKVIYELKDKINESKLFSVTFCLRNYFPDEGDYQFDIMRKLMDILNIPLKPLYGYTYRENHNQTAIMITMLFENIGEKEK